ncbi:radical SAM protein [Anaerovorax odorimutans]|uniref:radical SAM protein n=1 Tax=Anaerovorax odorimutans TaxID=109327 RepID=UPI000404686E|nr:radical SAM protein [Anaerovorax odorimutans]
MNIINKAKDFGFAQAIKYLEKDPEANIPKLLGLVDRFIPKDEFKAQREAIWSVVESKDNWYQLIMRFYELDPGIRTTFFHNFIMNANFFGWTDQDKNREKYNCNIPWTILLDPTSACNLNCTGCWAAEYGHKLNLSYEDIDSIIEQGKDLGIYFYIYTGGEPLVRKADLIKLCEKHSDCIFLCFTNGTLIDKEFCDNMLRVKNFVPAISLEGFEKANDSRRGAGTYSKVMNSMGLLKEKNLPFGVSVCYTKDNWDDVSSEEFYDKIIDMGALFVWFFHYMPVGKGAVPELMVTPEQRTELYERIKAFRKTKSIFAMDFQNDAQYVGGCIAGGRRYLHINAAGDVDPCVFIHYSNANIHDTTLLDALRSPIFMEYHNRQPFNDNMLRPCPMLENPEILPDMVKKAGAKSTNPEAPESAEELCTRTTKYAKNWTPVAEQLWQDYINCKNCSSHSAE